MAAAVIELPSLERLVRVETVEVVSQVRRPHRGSQAFAWSLKLRLASAARPLRCLLHTSATQPHTRLAGLKLSPSSQAVALVCRSLSPQSS